MTAREQAEQEIQDCLQKARDAEARATVATDPALKTDWTRIASGYRDLAQLLMNTAVMAEISDEPSAEG